MDGFGFRQMGTMDEFRQSGQLRPLYGGSHPCIRPTINHYETPHRPKNRLRIQGIARFGGKPQSASAFPLRYWLMI